MYVHHHGHSIFLLGSIMRLLSIHLAFLPVVVTRSFTTTTFHLPPLLVTTAQASPPPRWPCWLVPQWLLKAGDGEIIYFVF